MTAPRIVLLDNDSFSLGALHAPLIDQGYRIFRCRPRDLAEAHAVVKRAGADLVILDRWLAKRADGWAFVGRLCADRATAHIAAIIGCGTPDMPPGAADLPPTVRCRVMAKPFDVGELRDAIAALLGLAPPQRGHRPQLPADPAAPGLTGDPLARCVDALERGFAASPR